MAPDRSARLGLILFAAAMFAASAGRALWWAARGVPNLWERRR